MKRLLFRLIAAAVIGKTMVATAAAQDADIISGDCRNFSFVERFGDKTSDETGWVAFVLRDGAPAFKEVGDQQPLRTVDFSTGVYVNMVASENEGPSERVRISIPYERDAPMVWMNRLDLMCRLTPLVDIETGLERKALIRTKTTQREDGVVQAITASRSPVGDRAEDLEIGRKLSRFTPYLIYGESRDKYLLGDQFAFSNAEQRLVGWVRKEELIEWNWSIGLRPKLDLRNADGSVGRICGYESPTERKDCVPILAGNAWFKSDLRLPVLEVGADYYRVAGAASGFGGAEIVDGKIKLTKEMLAQMEINPGEAQGFDEQKIRSFNDIDVFFLIDGTKSMGPYIDAIRGTAASPGVIHSIVNSIERRGGGASIRAGFRVFRDSSSSGQTGVDEGYEFNDNACNSERPETAESRTQDRERFESRLATIRTTNEEADDYDENLLAGLDQASRDLYGCPERHKVLFVISDAGYDPDMQKSRDQEALSAFEVSQRLMDNKKLSVFFIRPPKRDKSEFRSEKSFSDYVESWEEYEKYGMYILDQVLARDTSSDLDVGDFFIDLERGATATNDMLQRISDYVIEVARPDVVNDILVDLRGGAALETVISRLQDQNKDVPVLYWNMMQRTACEGSEKLCRESVFDGIFDLYVPKDQPIELEAWMRADQLLNWREILEPIIKFAEYNTSDQRKAFGNAIRNSLASVLNLPTPQELAEPIGEYMRRSGLIPGPIKTPLLGYTFRQLDDAGALPVCEIDRLKVWLSASHQMLSNVLVERLSRYRIDSEARECPNMSEQGRQLKIIREAPESFPPGDNPDVYRLGNAFLGERIYWVPHDYLP